EKIHPYYSESKWEAKKHYILTLHDNMFECIAKEFELIEGAASMYNEATTLLDKLYQKTI
ncbi:MAG: hypothetical protein JWM96_872, partial [Alphaproteobacteria bacterium]|nr:hypothetical protein [Alphaproteobacteria bacterium]